MEAEPSETIKPAAKIEEEHHLNGYPQLTLESIYGYLLIYIDQLFEEIFNHL